MRQRPATSSDHIRTVLAVSIDLPGIRKHEEKLAELLATQQDDNQSLVPSQQDRKPAASGR